MSHNAPLTLVEAGERASASRVEALVGGLDTAGHCVPAYSTGVGLASRVEWSRCGGSLRSRLLDRRWSRESCRVVSMRRVTAFPPTRPALVSRVVSSGLDAAGHCVPAYSTAVGLAGRVEALGVGLDQRWR